MVLVRHLLPVSAQQRGAATVHVVLPRAQAKEIYRVIGTGHGKTHPEAEEVRRVREPAGIGEALHYAQAAIGRHIIKDGNRGHAADGRIGHLHQAGTLLRRNGKFLQFEGRVPPQALAELEPGAQVVLNGRPVKARHKRGR